MSQGVALIVLGTAAAAAAHVAQRIADAVSRDPATVLGLATGGTMLPVYALLAAARQRGDLSFSAATSFNLDEYVGLGLGHAASFAAFMAGALFGPVDFDPGRTHLPNGLAPDLMAEAARYEAAILAAGPIGLQLLGIGRNGHIGFNEPGTAFDSVTRVVRLSFSTRAANRPFFPVGEAVPEQALTMGIGTILRAREIVLLATGAAKAVAVAQAIAGPAGPHSPASALRHHGAATFVCDRAAASRLDPRLWQRSVHA